jgi:phospholipase/lecithinase/hemolysin
MSYFIAQKRLTDPNFGFTTDGIHPSPAGHLLMARAILDAIGADYQSGDLDAVAAKLNNDPLFQLVQHQRQLRSDGWLSYVGYTRDKTVKTDTIEETEQSVADLQSQIDAIRKNRP